MSAEEEVLEGFKIFAEYMTDGGVSVNTDQIFAGPDPVIVSREDIERLGYLGWDADYDYSCFMKWV